MSHPNRKSLLLGELERYPQNWVLTPVDGNKRPYRKGWQSETPLSREAIAQDIRDLQAQGVGIRSGQISGGILCIDFDGSSALPKYLELSGGIEPPLTLGWTSGRPGRWQLALTVPQEKWGEISTKKIPTAWDSDGKATEFLELRWDSCQSVLPGSVHPKTGSYNWLPGQSPAECEIALAPDFILDAATLEPKYHEAVERVPSTPTDNPWDIRNFACYLDGYRPDGRRGWDTCKCPAHNGESDNSLHIEQTTGAFKCHAGCDSKEVYHAALELAKSRGYQIPAKRSRHRFSDLGGWMFKIKQQLDKTIKRRSIWGFGRKGEVEIEKHAPKIQPAIEYAAGERLNVWAAPGADHPYILDTSGTAQGKSFDAGLVTPGLFGARQVIYLSAEHRNPSTPTLKSWADLEARHKGLYRDEFGKLRRVNAQKQPYVVAPNCGRNETISALRSKNIADTDTASLICNTCPYQNQCRAGATYNYLNARMKSLEQPRVRAHPQSLPSPNEFDYSGVVLIWDEAMELIKPLRSTEVKAEDLQQVIAELAVKLPATFDALRPLLTSLYKYICGEVKQPNKYGWGDTQLRAALSVPDGVDSNAVRDALAPDLRFLNTTEEYGVDLADLPPRLKKSFSDTDKATAERISKEIALDWLPDFLEVLQGDAAGSIRIQYGVLTVTLKNARLAEIAKIAKSNIFLDATASVEEGARVLGIDASKILTVRQVMPSTSNLEIIQIGTMGRLGVGSKRSEFCQGRLDALVSQIRLDIPGKVAVIDFKNKPTGYEKRNWWVDSLGINDLEDCDALILVGTPCRNLGAMSAEFTVLFGRPPQEGTERVKFPVQINGTPSADLQPWFEMNVSVDPEFRSFCRRRILADIHQAIGRLRAHRRTEKQLRVYFIADYPLDIPVTLKKASDITPEAATKTERLELAIRAAARQLKEAGQKITQSALAAHCGCSQQHIARFKVLLISLLEASNSKMSKTGEPPPVPDETRWVSQKYLPLLAESPPPELLSGVLDTFEAYGRGVFQGIWDATPATAQVKILQALALCLPWGEFRELAKAAGVNF